MLLIELFFDILLKGWVYHWVIAKATLVPEFGRAPSAPQPSRQMCVEQPLRVTQTSQHMIPNVKEPISVKQPIYTI